MEGSEQTNSNNGDSLNASQIEVANGKKNGNSEVRTPSARLEHIPNWS